MPSNRGHLESVVDLQTVAEQLVAALDGGLGVLGRIDLEE